MEELKREQNELNDILIKRDNGGGGKLKNVLLMTAALLLIVIIGILAFRIIEAGTTDVEREVKPVEAPAPVESPKSMFETTQPETPKADEAKRTLDEMIQRHREAREKEMAAAPATEADKQLPPIPVPPIEEKVMAETPKPAEPAKAEKTQEAPKPVTKVEPAKTEPAKPAAPKAETKPVTKVQPKPAAGTFFVQVESLSKEPRADYLKLLKNKGFNVVVRDRTVDGKSIKRVYVGPYMTKEEAAAVLPTLRRDFNPEAFVIQD